MVGNVRPSTVDSVALTSLRIASNPRNRSWSTKEITTIKGRSTSFDFQKALSSTARENVLKRERARVRGTAPRLITGLKTEL